VCVDVCILLNLVLVHEHFGTVHQTSLVLSLDTRECLNQHLRTEDEGFDAFELMDNDWAILESVVDSINEP
jgi:hypothetical protein